MSETLPVKTKVAKRAVRVASRKLAAFENRFGAAHMALLYQAAFPLALTPDLLYRLWANFQWGTQGTFLNIPWIAVSDILLSGLCEEVGQELYELDNAVRDELLQRLQTDQRLGSLRVQELSAFLLEYVEDQLQSSDPDVRDFAQSQQWTALAYTRPGKVTREIAAKFQSLGLEATQAGSPNKSELIRMAAVVETFAIPLADAELSPLLTYAQGMARWAQGDVLQAAEQLSTVSEGGRIQIAGVELPLPNDLAPGDAKYSPPTGPADYSGLSLRGRSFRGQDLTDANFSHADIRGADFTDAVLVRANFCAAKTGLQRRWAMVVMLIALILSGLCGSMAGFIGWIAWLGLMPIVSASAMTLEYSLFLVSILVGFGLFYALFIISLRRPLTADWLGGGLASFGTLLFGVVGLVFSISMEGYFTVGYSAFNLAMIAGAMVLLVGLTWRLTGTLFSVLQFQIASFVGAILIVLGIINGSRVTAIVATALVALYMALWFIWSSRQRQKLSTMIVTWMLFSLTSAAAIGLTAWIDESDILAGVGVMLVFAIVVPTLTASLPLSGIASIKGAFVGTILVTVAIALFSVFVGFFASSILFSIGTVAVSSLMLGVIAWAVSITLAVTFNLIWAEADSRAIAVSWILLGVAPFLVGVFILILRAIPWAPALGLSLWEFLFTSALGFVLFCSIMFLGIYVGWSAIAQDSKFSAVRSLVITFMARGGTSFRRANLTEATFTDARLKSANFRKANLTRTCWFHAQKLDHADMSGTSLSQPSVRQLLVTGIGQGKTFEHLDLSGADLRRANLCDASFIETDLSGANLKEANLSRATLVGTQLESAQLFGIQLTGAYIKDVCFTDAIQLGGVECEYLYTSLSTAESPDPGRVPMNRQETFQPREFIRFMLHNNYPLNGEYLDSKSASKPAPKSVSKSAAKAEKHAKRRR